MGAPRGGRGSGQSCDHRDLKDSLGGAIFGCIDKTYRECVDGLVFGLPASNMRWVKYVASGMPIFLFNYNTKMLHGIFVATTSGQMNINPCGWTSVSNTQETRYPAQVKVKVLERCAAMPERQFSKFIEGAYFAHGKFSYQLTHDEAMALCKAFSLKAHQTLMQGWEEQASHLGTTTPAMSWEQGQQRPQGAEGWEEQASVGMVTPVMSWEQEQPRPQVAESQSKAARASETPVSIKQEGWDSSSQRSESPDGSCQFSGGRQSGSTTPSATSQPQQAMPKPRPKPRQLPTQEKGRATISGAAKAIAPSQPQTSESILMMGGSVPSPSDPWIDTVDAWDPATGIHTPLFSLPEVSAYGAAAKMGSDVFFLGGGKGTIWSRQCLKATIGGTWQQMPEMHRGRGSLMAVIHDGSPWAIGGRDAVYHSSTERLDLASGQWVIGPEMQTRRFACAGGVLGSGIIVTGGFDGMEYQRSVERLDPRMKRSVTVAEMTQARGTHSCVLLNGVLYAAGGWALSSALDQFEQYDERADKWAPLPPMQETRSYLAAAACNGKIFALGGLRLSNNQAVFSASVEVYDPARTAWSYLDLPETFIKRRAFASAISAHSEGLRI